VRRYGRISISVSCVTVVAQGEKLIWLDRAVVDRLRLLRGAGETFSDVILRIATDRPAGQAFPGACAVPLCARRLARSGIARRLIP
jgi:hypothetical protein